MTWGFGLVSLHGFQPGCSAGGDPLLPLLCLPCTTLDDPERVVNCCGRLVRTHPNEEGECVPAAPVRAYPRVAHTDVRTMCFVGFLTALFVNVCLADLGKCMACDRHCSARYSTIHVDCHLFCVALPVDIPSMAGLIITALELCEADLRLQV